MAAEEENAQQNKIRFNVFCSLTDIFNSSQLAYSKSPAEGYISLLSGMCPVSICVWSEVYYYYTFSSWLLSDLTIFIYQFGTSALDFCNTLCLVAVFEMLLIEVVMVNDFSYQYFTVTPD